MPGALPPTGIFDPWGLADASEVHALVSPNAHPMLVALFVKYPYALVACLFHTTTTTTTTTNTTTNNNNNRRVSCGTAPLS
jgi:hypothetical protein